MAGAVALVAARPLVTSDGPAWSGDGQPFALFWILLVLAWLTSRLAGAKFTIRWNWLDLAVVSFFALWSWAAILGGSAAAPRPAINELWDGVSLLMSYLLLRQLAPSPREQRAIAAVMIGVAIVLSVLAAHQYFVSLPADRALFEKNPAEAFRQAGFSEPPTPDSTEYKRFTGRLNSPQALGTFALSNSLAAFLAPWLVVGVGVSAQVIRQRADFQRRALAGCAIATAVIAIAMALTFSRAGAIAAVVGLASTAWLLLNRRSVPTQPSASRWKAVVIAAVALVLVGGIALMMTKPELLNRAKTSFGFRLQYWEATARLVADYPLLGVGPGQFGDYYTQYKLPEASEEIQDPHNFAFEIAACAGLPALAAFVLVLAIYFAAFLRRQDANGSFASEPATEAHLGWPLAGGVGGVLVAIVLYPLLAIPGHPLELLTGLVVAAVVVWLLGPWIVQGELPPATWAVVALTLLVALLSSGGIRFGGVAGTLWLAIVLGATAIGVGKPIHVSRLWGLLLVIALGAAGFAQYRTGYRPTLRSHGAMAILNEAFYHGDRSRMISALQLAGEADPWANGPKQIDLQRAMARWRGSGQPGERSRLAVENYHDVAEAWLAVDPHSAAAEEQIGVGWLEIFRDSHDARDGQQAVRRLRRAAELYPTNSQTQLELAQALDSLQNQPEANKAAAAALRLDDQMPHEDMKLTREQRRDAERIVSGEKDKNPSPLVPPRGEGAAVRGGSASGTLPR